MKKIIIILILLLFPASSFAAITFDASGKWETTFDCGEISQADVGTWPNCEGIDIRTNRTLPVFDLSDGVSNLWTQSPNNTDEYYYTGTAYDGLSSVKALSINFVNQEWNNSPGTLGLGEWGWGDVDSIGADTAYIRSTIDPDSQASGYVYGSAPRASYSSGDYVSSITTSANNSIGSGRGYRCLDADGFDQDTGSIAIQFDTPQKELWIRWYQRFEEGYRWFPLGLGEFPLFVKQMYLYTTDNGNFDTQAIVELRYDNFVVATQGAVTTYPLGSDTVGYGWLTIMETGAGDETHRASDGLYHYYEAHLKMDTIAGNDGIGQLWVDGNLVSESSTVTWSNDGEVGATPESIATNRLGWTFITVGENQATTATVDGVPKAQDYDDITIVNSDTYTGFTQDTFGNDMIGPLGATPTPTTPGTIKGFVISGAVIK